jgi:hypothetical protein
MNVATSVLVGALLLVAWAGRASAAEAASPADEPYRLLVLLRFSDEAAFTPRFVRSLDRQVRDQMRNLFGALAEVEVLDRHPLIDRLNETSLAELSLKPAEFATALVAEDRSFEKAFLFDVDWRDGEYLLAWRQLDAEVQQIGPLRRQQTPNRQWVGKAIGQSIREDFSPVARVIPTVERDKVQLEFRGSHIDGGALLAPWLGEDCFLQPFWIVQQGDGSLTRMPLPFTVLHLDRDGGHKWAQAITNLPNPWLKSPRVVGFQAWKLHTQAGRFRLQVLDQATGAPLQNCSVYAGSRGFDAITDADRLADPDAHGYVVSGRPFERLAYIRISQGAGGGGGVQLPLPITSDWCELTCRVAVDAAASEKSDLQRETGYLVEDLKALETGISDRVQQVNKLNADKRYEDALRAAREALDYGEKFSQSLPKSVRSLEDRWKLLKASPGPALAWLEKETQELQRQREGLQKLADNLDRTIRYNDAQSRANVLIELGRQYERDGDIDQAIDKYVLAIGEQADQPELAKHLEHLKAAWKIKGAEHRDARDFVYSVWAKAEVADLQADLPKAEQAFAVLKQAGDYLSARKLMKTNQRLVADADRLVQQLAGRNEEADRQEHEKYVGLLERLAKLQQQVAEFCAAAAKDELGPTSFHAQQEDDPKAKSSPSGERTPSGKRPTEPPQPTDEEEEQPLKQAPGRR